MKPYECMSLEDLPGEEWRPVVGHEEYYKVSSLGRVKSLPRQFFKRKKKADGTLTRLKERVVKQGVRPARVGLYVCFWLPARRTKAVSRVVASAFLDPDDTFSRKEVKHIDGDVCNNRVDNLVICPRANYAGFPRCRSGLAPPAAKLSEDDVRVIRHLYSDKAASYKQLARDFGVTPQSVYCVVHRRTWDHVQ